MKRVLFLFMALIPLFGFAGRETLADGNTSAYWDDRTSTIQYNSYRVDVRLTRAYSKNVWGTVELFYDGKCVGSKPFMIKAGEMRADVDFDNLSNNVRYDIRVTISGN